jgi:hypothetical protein
MVHDALGQKRLDCFTQTSHRLLIRAVIMMEDVQFKFGAGGGVCLHMFSRWVMIEIFTH